jgi:hypothetical protein
MLGINNNVGYEQGINEAWVMSKLPTKEEMTKTVNTVKGAADFEKYFDRRY